MELSLSKDLWKHYEKSGKNEFVKCITNLLNTCSESNGLVRKNRAYAELCQGFYDILQQFITGRIRRDSLLSTYRECMVLNENMSSLVLDVFNTLDAETGIKTKGNNYRQTYCQVLKDLGKVIPSPMIKERIEIDTLQESGIVKLKGFYTKFIKVKTKLYYKQRRFNLFREESEGYGKLLCELNQNFEFNIDPKNVMNMIKSLIGCFNLDPNRVLDVILESYEVNSERFDIFIPILNSYMPDGRIICEVLGYKYRYFANESTPTSLFHVTALLLKHSIIDLDNIYTLLNPPDKAICDDWETELADAKEFVRKLNIIVTNKDKEPEPEPEKVDFAEKYKKNQKFGLCQALLNIGDWKNAQLIFNKLPIQAIVVNEPIAKALAALVHNSIDDIYTKRCFSPASSRKPLNNNRPIINEELIAQNISEFPSLTIPMIIALGPSLHFDPVLITKLIRLMRSILLEIGENEFNAPEGLDWKSLYYGILTVLDAAILPALSYLDCNCCVAEEIWTVVRQYPYNLRYGLYGVWKNKKYLLHPMLIRRRGIVQKNSKALMKRVSKENVKPVGRLIGKLSHCSPGILFDYILLQIQIYDNLIGPVVDSLKYLTSLSYDVLGYCLIEALALADKERFKHDGTSLSMWLQSLASFCGAIFKKYNIELSGLLQYVANQLKSQNSLDLLVLKEVVIKMTGIEATEEMTNEQLNAMSGGELLRGEAGYFSQVRNTKKSSQRLKDALASNDLAVTLCLLMAQQKQCVIYRETTHSHLKLVGKLYDQCQDTLVQFGTFLGSTYSVEEYVERLPSIITMLQEYHINSDVAFFLARPMFSHQINQKYDQLRKSDPNSKKLTTSQKLQKYLEATTAVMIPIVESVRPMHGPKIWEDISPQFLVTFWSLSMHDLQVPSESYQKEILKLKQLSLSVVDSKDMNVSKGKKEQERYLALMDKLQDEKKKQQEHVDKTLQRLIQEKDNWFLSRSAKSAKNETISQFLQLCLFPRCNFTALDALYCAKFVHTIHYLKASNFSTLLCYDRIFCDITFSVTSCTENEATRYGRFLCAMLETVMRWHSDQTIFNKECASYPGFVTKFRVSNQFSEANDHVGYENYRHVCHKWHYKITKAIVFCLDSKDYMQIRNALIILMRVLSHYPVLAKLAQIIERKVEKVREEEKNNRPDLFVIASSYIGQLKNKAPHMIKESDFHQVAEKPIKEMSENFVHKVDRPTNGESRVERRDKGEKIIKISSSLEKEIKTDSNEDLLEREHKLLKELKKEERAREKERDRGLEDESRKREKEKRKEHKLENSVIIEIPSDNKHSSDYYEYEKDHEKDRDRGDRDLSSVSNSSNGSIHRRQDILEIEKETYKRRKMESTSSKKQQDEAVENSKKDRSSKTKDRKEKLTEEEKDARKERKLGRKRERLEENSIIEHKRRREVQNGDDDVREKYNLREKSPRVTSGDNRERSHEKFERDRQYGMTKSTRSRIGY